MGPRCRIPPPTATTLHRLLDPLVALLLVSIAISFQAPLSGQTVPPSTPAAADVAGIPYRDVVPILDSFAADLPEGLAGRTPEELETYWPSWLARRNADIRARIAQGDEDSLVNLWLFGTTFTSLPPVRADDLARLDRRLTPADVLEGRLRDLLDGIRSPGDNARLQFARDVVVGRAIDPASAAGRQQVRALLVSARERVLEENRATDDTLARARASGGSASELAAHATIFRNRGLSSDTSILPCFGVEEALAGLVRSAALLPGTVRRVAIVGPGLDVINKAGGQDFYPPQTIQPLALIDSLRRLGLAARDGVQVTTFDVSGRVNRHIEQAANRARDGAAYVVYLPLGVDEHWTSDLLAYWERWGDRIDDRMAPVVQPPDASVRVRAVRVRPDVVSSLQARDVNIVVERAVLPPSERFDLVVATNVLVYYDAFEQSLALANIAAMLRPGGSLLSNTLLESRAPMKPSAAYADVIYSDRQFDRFFWYQRQ